MAIDTTPRKTVDETVIAAQETLAAYNSDAPLLSGRELPFLGDSGDQYVLHTASILGAGGQGTIVIATDAAGNPYAAKIAYQPQNVKEKITRNKVLTFLRSLMTNHPLKEQHYTQTHLMPLFAYGEIVDSVEGLGSSIYDVTIMPICDDSLGKRTDVSFEEIQQFILPQTAEALHLLHENRIVHRDIKPKNLYLLHDSIVIGDFGISSVLDEGRDTGTTKIDRRTPGYSPHSSTVQCENDWYALGYTLWTLYNNGVHPHQALIDSDDLSDVLAGKRPVAFVAKEPEHETLGQLIFGLTLAHSQGRLGYEAIQEYLANPSSFRYSDQTSSTTPRMGYQFEQTVYTDKTELCNALLNSWEKAKRHLYTNTLADHFRVIGESDLAVALTDLVEIDPTTVRDQDFGLSKALPLISGDPFTFYWKGTKFSLNEIDEYLLHLSKDEDIELLESGLFGWQATLFPPENAELAQILTNISNSAEKNSSFAYAYALQLFSNRQETSWHNFADADEAFSWLSSDPIEFYDMLYDEDLMAELCGFMSALGYNAQASKALNQLSEDDWQLKATGILLCFEQVCDNPAAVRRFYKNFGPLSYISWISENTGKYFATKGSGKDLLSKLAAVKVNATDSIVEMQRTLTGSANLALRLKQQLEESAYIHAAGIKNDDTTIYPKDADGYFSCDFRGIDVPRGYMRAVFDAMPEYAATKKRGIEPFMRQKNERLKENAVAKINSLKGQVDALKTGTGYGIAGKSKLFFIAYFVLGIIAIFATAAAWPTINAQVYNSMNSALVGFDFTFGLPVTTFTVPAFWAFLIAAATVVARKGRTLLLHTRSKITEATIDASSKSLATLASSIKSGHSDAELYMTTLAKGNCGVTYESTKQISKLRATSAASSSDNALMQRLYHAGMIVSFICLLIPIMVGTPETLWNNVDLGFGFPIDEIAYLLVVVLLNVTILYFTSDLDQGILVLLVVVLMPLLAVYLIPLILGLLTVAIVLFVLWLIFVR